MLFRKAAQGEAVLDAVLGLPQIHDETIGYHAQQAADKLLKAVLAARGVVYRRTHNLSELVLLLQRSGMPLPECLRPLCALTPFAVESRYGDLPAEQTALDRTATRERLRGLRSWAEEQVAAAG